MVQLDRRDDSGAVALLVAVLATVLFGFAAIVVDLGYARTVKSDSQSTVDAASLAGATVVAKDNNPSASTFDDATTAIKELANKNFGTTDADWDRCSATPPTASWVQAGSDTDCILYNKNARHPTKLQVVLPTKHVDSFFGGLFGYQGIDIGARAQVTIRNEEVPGCALCVQGWLETSGSITVDGGSDGGSASASDGHVSAFGRITVQDPGAITFAAAPSPTRGPSYSSRPLYPRPVSNPFLGDPLPSGGPGFPRSVRSRRTVTCGDGAALSQRTYGNIKVTGACTISNAVVVVTGRLQIALGGSLSAVSSAIQFSCGTRTAPAMCGAPTTNGGRLQIDAGGQLNMLASSHGEFSVVADPRNASSMVIDGNLSVDNAIYGRSTPVTLGTDGRVSASGRVVVGQLTIASGGLVNVSAAGEAPVLGPPFVGLYR